jgi:hypothetical protein
MQILFLSLPFRITTKVSDVLMRAKNLVYKNANRKLQYVIVLCATVYIASLPYFGWGITGICVAVTASAVFSYVTMLLTIKRRVFQHGWQKLIINPFKDGAILSVLIVTPSYLVYYLLMLIFNNELVSFITLCSILTIFFSYAFLKKPKLLGKDFVQLQKELMKIIRRKGNKAGGKRRRGFEQAETDLIQITE